MYAWRQWTPAMRAEVLTHRQRQGRPWHGPPHFTGQQTSQYLITGACFEHAPILGASPERMDAFAARLLSTLESVEAVVHAWCVLPNHYHALSTTSDLPKLIAQLGKLHGSTSFAWNGEDGERGRQCWHRATDRAMRSQEHFWATLNYLHHNPVRHGYVSKWQEWPWSSAREYLAKQGADSAARIWKAYPVLDYGAGWDDACL
jgi:putative transposase